MFAFDFMFNFVFIFAFAIVFIVFIFIFIKMFGSIIRKNGGLFNISINPVIKFSKEPQKENKAANYKPKQKEFKELRCPYCNAPIHENDSKCEYCGSKL